MVLIFDNLIRRSKRIRVCSVGRGEEGTKHELYNREKDTVL